MTKRNTNCSTDVSLKKRKRKRSTKILTAWRLSPLCLMTLNRFATSHAQGNKTAVMEELILKLPDADVGQRIIDALDARLRMKMQALQAKGLA